MLVGIEAEARFERGLAPLEAGDLGARPHDAPIRLDRYGLVGRRGERGSAGSKLTDQHLCGGVARGLPVDAVARRIGSEAEPVETTHIMILDQDMPIGADLCHDLLLVAQAPHQDAGAAVDETLRQTLM